MSRILIPLALLLTTACATTGYAGGGNGTSGLLVPTGTDEAFLDALETQLPKVGFEVKREGKMLRAEHENSFGFLMTYDELSSRLVYIAFFNLEEGRRCGEPQVEGPIDLANRRFNLCKVYCDVEDDTVGFEGVFLVPQRGIAPVEIRDYLVELSKELVSMTKKAGLYEHLR